MERKQLVRMGPIELGGSEDGAESKTGVFNLRADLSHKVKKRSLSEVNDTGKWM